MRRSFHTQHDMPINVLVSSLKTRSQHQRSNAEVLHKDNHQLNESWQVCLHWRHNNRIQRRCSRFFNNLLTAPRTVSNTYAQVARAQSFANHVQHIQRLSRANVMLRATWYKGTAQLLSLTELKSHYLSFILLAEPLNWWRRGGNRSTRRKPLATSFRKCHILQPEDSSPKRDSNSRSSIGGRLGKQTC